jgi:hypothetical protein
MIKKIVWFLILPLVVGVSVYLIFFKQKPTTTGDTTSDDTHTSQESYTDTTNEEEEEKDTSTTDTKEEEVQTITGFSTESQTVGATSSSKYTIEEISNTSHADYHEFVFTLSSTGTDDPNVIAEYKSGLGVIRLDFNQVEKDNSGIGYQKEVSINKEGISRLYHNVSSDQTEELYDIGVTKETAFKLISEKVGDNWEITIYVQYPGESSSTVDTGSTSYGTQPQSITGVDASKGATVSSYTYGISGGVLKFVWNVSSTDTNPIPNVNATYDSENRLVVTFTSLKTDKVYLAVDGMSLPGGLAMQTEKIGESTTYTISGFSSQVEYKLSAGTSPNQVVLEIEL